ncbi:MAG TPA: efflux RND transporter periplasmic adaptor subunit [Gemmatimonadales bacterium]|nr:efflux RND transporter periplasmic adaptor subunit [Gemmatimonadales bacterium]
MTTKTIGVRALVALLLITGCKKAGGFGGFPPTQVTIVTAQRNAVPETYQFPGAVLPYRRVEVRSRVDGIITAREFDEGQIVQPGQVLYQIDTVRYAAAYHSAEARLATAKSTFNRVEPLLAQHAVAEQDVDNARSSLAAAQAVYDQAKKDYDDTQIKAEIEGRVGRTNLEVGARVTGSGDLLTTIDRIDPVYISFRPSSSQLLDWQRHASSRSLTRAGSALEVQAVLPDGSTLPRTGRLDFVAPSLDAATGTQEFRATFQNPDHLLMPGQFVQVRLLGFTRDSAIAVPQRAVQTGLGRQFVYVVGAGDTVHAKDIVPGPWSGDQWIISSGLNPGDRVIVDGVQKVFPGRTVVPKPLADSASVPGKDR